MSTPLRDQRIGKRLALTGGVRILKQAHNGGTTRDNVTRINDYRMRAADVPLETKIKPVGYVPIARWKSLVPIYY
jgi:hypothetical protein